MGAALEYRREPLDEARDMTTHTISQFKDARQSLTNQNLAQALYDEGSVVMEDVLLCLHGPAHRQRRNLEFRVFRRGFFRFYEQEIFPKVLQEVLAPYLEKGAADLVEFGYRVTMNLTADFAGVDRPAKTVEETESLYGLVKTFSEGATLVHSTRNKEEVRAEVRQALIDFDERFLRRSIERRQALLADFEQGKLEESDLPRDVLTILLRNEDKLELPSDLLRREIAFYLQAGSHSTANSTVHAMHEVFTWCAAHPEDRVRIAEDPIFLQRCVHESLRLHPASPVAWRRPLADMELSTGESVKEDDRVILDLRAANRDKNIFGDDAETFDPRRQVAKGCEPFGLTFGTGVHTCLGRDLDGGVVPRAEADPDSHQYGIVTLLVRALLDSGARPDPKKPPIQDSNTERVNWGSYPILFE